jgi:hypothetical protein
MNERISSDPYPDVSAERVAELLRIKGNLSADLGAASDSLLATTEELAIANTSLAEAHSANVFLAAERDVLLSELIQAREFIRVETPHRATITHLDKVIEDSMPPVNLHDLPWFTKVLEESKASLEAAYDLGPNNVPSWYRQYRAAQITADAKARLEAAYDANPASVTAWYREHRERKAAALPAVIA